jgi:hypothetical protein
MVFVLLFGYLFQFSLIVDSKPARVNSSYGPFGAINIDLNKKGLDESRP